MRSETKTGPTRKKTSGNEYFASNGPPARLVSVALDGTVTEWNLNALKPHPTSRIGHGRSIWGLRVANRMEAVKPGQAQRLAIACDDGCVRLVISIAKSAVGVA